MSYIEALDDPDVQTVQLRSNTDQPQQDTNNLGHPEKDNEGKLHLQSDNIADVQHQQANCGILPHKPFIGEWCKMFGLDCTTATYLDRHHYRTGDDIVALEVDDIIRMDLDGTQKGLLRVASLLYRHTRPSRDKQLAAAGVKIIWTTPGPTVHPLDGTSAGGEPLRSSNNTEELRRERSFDSPQAEDWVKEEEETKDSKDSVEEEEETNPTTDPELVPDVTDISVEPELTDPDRGRMLMENAIKQLEADLLAEKIQLNMILDRSSPDVAAVSQDGVIDLVRGRQLMEEAVRKVVEELLTDDEIKLIMKHSNDGSSDVDTDSLR